jgi:hypothetical protein
MTTETAVRTFETPNVAGVDGVAIYVTDWRKAELPFYATQFTHRKTFDDGTKWLDERDDYITTEEYRRAVAEHTHIPIADIRLEALPVAHGVI